LPEAVTAKPAGLMLATAALLLLVSAAGHDYLLNRSLAEGRVVPLAEFGFN
jgi:hypothetical protein